MCSAMSEWVQRKNRYPVKVDATVFREDGMKSPARLTNLSNQGCAIEAGCPLDVQERVQIAIPRMGMIKAQIQWTAGDKAGAKFIIDADF